MSDCQECGCPAIQDGTRCQRREARITIKKSDLAERDRARKTVEALRLIEQAMMMPVQCGKTTAICEAAKLINATVLCTTTEHARQIALNHHVKTVSIHNRDELLGTRGPFLLDHLTSGRLASGTRSIIKDLLYQLEGKL